MTSPSTDRRYGVNSSMAFKVPALVATTANLTLEDEQTIDGVACVTGDRVLVKDQTDTTENGVYDVDTGEWQRSVDFDGTRDIAQGTLLFVISGATNKGLWYVSTADPEIDSALAFTLALAIA